VGKRDNLSGTQVRSAVGDQANGLSLPGRTLQNADDKGGRLNGVSATATAIGMGLALQSGSPDGLQAFAETLPEGDAPVPDAKAADKTPAAQDQTVLDADQDGGNATAHPFEIASLDVAAESAAVGDTTDAAAEPKMASLGAAPLHGSQDDQPYFKQSVKPGEDTDPTLHTPSSPKPEVSNDTPSSPPPMPVTDTLLGEDGVVDTVVDTLLGEDGVVDTVVDTLLGEDGVVDTVVDTLLGEDGVVDTVVDTLLGEDGVVDTVVDTLLGDDGVVDVVLGDDGIVDTILGDDGVVDTVIDTVLGDDGVVDVVLGDDGIVDTVLGDDGVVETVVDTVLGDDGVVDVVLGDDGIVDTILGDDGVVGTVVDTVLGDDGIVGTLVGGILGGITEDDSPDVLDDPVSVVVDSIDPLTDVVTDTVETVVDTTDDLIDTVSAPVETVVDTTDDLIETVSAPLETVVDTTDDLIDTVSAPLETVVDTTDDLIDTVTAPLETVTDTTDDLIDTVSAPLETVTDTNDDLIETVSAPVETVVEDVTSGLTPLVEDLIGEDGILDGDDGFLDTLIGGDSPTSLLGFGGGGDSAEASVFGGLLGEEDIFGLDVDVDTDVGADDLFAGLSGDASLTGTLVDQGLFEDAASGDGAAPDPEIDDLLNDILAGGVEDVLGEQNTFNDLLDAAAPDGDGLLSDAEGSGLLVDNAVDDAMNTLFNTGGDAETSLLDGLFDSSSDNDAV
tara:strand:+ start:12080 stop:14260 length:2181 start_codon:yes stop_codon:yes gene_type:complete